MILLLLSIYISVIYSILVYHLVVNRKIKEAEKIGWIGLICFMVFLFLVISSSYLMPWLVLVFLIFCVVYFIGSIIVIVSKWGDEPLPRKEIAKGILLFVIGILFGGYIAIEQEQEKRKEKADSLACLPHRHDNDVDACEKHH